MLLTPVGRPRPAPPLAGVAARHRRPGLERRAAQGAEGIQVPPPLPLGLRRRRDVSDALLPLVRPAREVARRRVPERLPPLQQGRERLDELVSLVRGGFHRTGPRPPGT